ncbi:MAG: AAA family ATPase [Lachnospiraceae bacterium]|nr:AAA family ATPase [Lachnospiraceae bacterium]
MFESFKKLSIQGGCFDSVTELELFKKDPVSIIYGRNGSGKTTIAYSIGELTKPIDERNSDFIVSSDTPISEDKKDCVFIFNEDFVREQVRVEKDGINTIVMLGEQVELDEKITKLKDDLLKLQDEYKKLAEEKDKYENASLSVSPSYYFNQIRDGLRSDGGWADIDRDLKGNVQKSRINDDVVNRLMSLEEPTEDFETLRERVMTDLNLYQESENAQPIIWTKIEPKLPDSLVDVSELLAKPLDAPVLSDREQRLIKLLSTQSRYSTEDAQRLLESDWDICPVCYRDLTNTDKNELVQILTHILNKEATEYKRLLQEALDIFIKIETELPVFGGNLNDKELNGALIARTNINDILQIVRDRINQRNKNIYQGIEKPFSDDELKMYSDALTIWINALQTIENCVTKFNDSVKKRNNLYKNIRKNNDLLARKQLSSLFYGYKQALANSDKNRKALLEKDKECKTIQEQIKELQSQKERTDIALSYINQELQYVFYSNRKVKLEPGDGCYKLKINGKSVKPKKISVGERNVLGLCYFFAKLFGGKTTSNKYATEYLIVIDDPVSSFDYGNRIGVMSLLRYQFGNIIRGNTGSRILVLSHDLHSIFDLVKIRNEVIAGKNSDRSFMELRNNNLEVKSVRNEYKKLLDSVYAYASNSETTDPDETLEISIGNIMRRLLEAFSSFCYNDSFEKMLRKDDILLKIPENKRIYYGNFMYRLTLNTESHMEESIYSLDSLISCITRDEKVQTAKSILLFLSYINDSHLSAYLSEEQLLEIEKWKSEEDSWVLTSI